MSNNMSENMSDEKQNIESRHRDGNLNKEHKKAEVTAKTAKKKFNPVTVFCVCSLAIIVLMTIYYCFNRNIELNRDLEYLYRENSTLKTLLKGKAVMSDENKEVQQKYNRYVDSVLKQYDEKKLNLEYRKKRLKD